MATVIDDLLVRLGFDADTSGAASFDTGIGKIIKTVGQAGAVIGGMAFAVTGAMTKVALDTAAAADETQRFADIAGVTTKELQLMTAGASRYGVEQDKLTDILKDFGDKTGDYIAGEGGAMKDFFEGVGTAAGLTADSFKGLSSAEGLQLYVDTLEGANLSQAEMIFYMEGIASDATLLLPLLKDGGKGFKEWGDEAQKAGKIMSDTDLAASKELLDNVEKAKYVYSGLLTTLSKKATPYINDALQWIIENEDELRAAAEELSAAFDTAITAIGDAYNFVGDKIQWLDDNSQRIIDTLKMIGVVAGVIATALTIMYAPAIAGFIVMRATAIASFLMMQAAAIASAAATAAAWLVAFAPFLLIGAVIAVVIGLLWLIYQNWQQIAAGIAAEWQKLLGVFSSVAAQVSAIWSGLWSSVKSMASGAIDFVIGKIQAVISMIGGAIGKVKELAAYNPVALGGKAASWAAGKLGIGGGSNTSNVNQTFNVSSAGEATSIAKGSTGAQRRSNTGVKQ